ncbi:MAG: phage baseplate assembly protein V, partial [Defluviitaleaceae bacterium]|nr:phage baseplate assembly protein V [Defluviitaleaceae bacterium]
NKETTYGDLVDAVAGAGVCSTGDYADESIEEFALQYKETDWEFLIRMASRAGTGLVADYTSEKPKFKFVEEIDEGSFNIDDDRLISVSKSIVGGKEKMSYFFALEKGYEKGDDTRDCFIGSKFNYTGENISNSNLLCKSLEANIIEGAIIYTVELSDDLSEEEIFNDKISGVSLKCKVLANDGSDDSLAKLKVKIEDFEDEDSQNPILFPYATLYAANDHGGWFFMPEEDDTVMLYFPNNKEKNAFCTCSRREKDLPDNITPETKIISAPNGKIIEINEDEISIASSENTFIRMSKDSVEIRSDKPLKIETGDDLTMESRGKIVIQSEAGIDLSASGSSIKMAANVDLEGSNVKIS